MNTAIIDGDSLVWWACYPKKLQNEEGETTYVEKTLEEAKESFSSMLRMIMKGAGCNQYYGFLSGGRSKRDLINPEYKAQRSKEKPEFYTQVEEYAINVEKFVVFEDYEADDCVITARNLLNLEAIPHKVLALDKDVLNSAGYNYDFKNNRDILVTPYESERKFWISMITGDTADNIKGIPGKGIKYAEHSLDRMYASDSYSSHILDEYISHFGERNGIQEFYKNYFSLRLISFIEGFNLGMPVLIDDI